MKVLGIVALLFVCVLQASANTEKTIFLGPPATDAFRDASSILQDLRLIGLSPSQPSQRLSISVAFPSTAQPNGLTSWYVLHGLQQGQRYETRLCWSATQPTVFDLETFELAHVLHDEGLMHSLSAHSIKSENMLGDGETEQTDLATLGSQSALLLRMQSAADFYTTNGELMRTPPNVDIDLILDPFLLGVLPRSLLFTVAYVLAVAVAGIFMANSIWSKLFQAGGAIKDRRD